MERKRRRTALSLNKQLKISTFFHKQPLEKSSLENEKGEVNPDFIQNEFSKRCFQPPVNEQRIQLREVVEDVVPQTPSTPLSNQLKSWKPFTASTVTIEPEALDDGSDVASKTANVPKLETPHVTLTVEDCGVSNDFVSLPVDSLISNAKEESTSLKGIASVGHESKSVVDERSKVDVKSTSDVVPNENGCCTEERLRDTKKLSSPAKVEVVRKTLAESTDDEDDLAMSSSDLMILATAEEKLLNDNKADIISHDPFLENNGRRRVVKVVESDDKSSIDLRLLDEKTNTSCVCRLKDFWNQTVVAENDYVNVLAPFDVDGVATIDNCNGLVIVHPDKLISGTSVVSSLFCMRKVVLSEEFKSYGGGNFSMVCGSLVHQLFQEILQRQITETSFMEETMRKLLKNRQTLQTIFEAELSEKDVANEVGSYIPMIQRWQENHVSKPPKDNRGSTKVPTVQVLSVQDIEESFWSPRFGLKGKVDLSVRVEINNNKKMVPLEVKTGKASFSLEHQGQVTLYTMMFSDRRQDPHEGLLLYLKTGEMKTVSAEHRHKRGLMQLRNELAHYLTRTPAKRDDRWIPPELPDPICSERFCTNCPYLLPCTLHLKLNKTRMLRSDHAMHNLIPQTLAHLSATHLDYFSRWQLMLKLEDDTTRINFLRALHSRDNGNRSARARVDPNFQIKESESGYFTMSFVLETPICEQSESLTPGDYVIISCEDPKEFALTTATVIGVQDSNVEVEAYRSLASSEYENKVFRLDVYQEGTLDLSSHLLTLMENSQRSERLRRLIIDTESPEFVEKLSKGFAIKGRSLLKGLNAEQLKAVFKSLMAKDYLLINGMPGTGKTSTIVALIRILVRLNRTVLVTAYTHSAVDNILLKLKDHSVKFLRLGRSERFHKKLKLYSEDSLLLGVDSVEEMQRMYDSRLVVATTCLGVRHSLFRRRHFDYCILDESSQVLQMATLGPLFHADRFILVGDPQQLPPVIRSNSARELGMEQSLFARLHPTPSSTVELSHQYRMNKEIMRVANEFMYDNKLQCTSATVMNAVIDVQNSLDISIPLWMSRALSNKLEDSVMFLDTDPIRDKTESQQRNEDEARIIHQLVRLLLNGGLRQSEVGVISPYRSQVLHLTSLLRPTLSDVEINTVDQYQGRDKAVVLVSCVRTRGTSERSACLLNDPRRLNVAITRAKKKLIFVGSKSTLLNHVPFKKLFGILCPSQVIEIATMREANDSKPFQVS